MTTLDFPISLSNLYNLKCNKVGIQGEKNSFDVEQRFDSIDVSMNGKQERITSYTIPDEGQPGLDLFHTPTQLSKLISGWEINIVKHDDTGDELYSAVDFRISDTMKDIIFDKYGTAATYTRTEINALVSQPINSLTNDSQSIIYKSDTTSPVMLIDDNNIWVYNNTDFLFDVTAKSLNAETFGGSGLGKIYNEVDNKIATSNLNYYDKDEIDNDIYSKIEIDGMTTLSNYYLKSYIDGNIYLKTQVNNIATLTNFYNKTQTDGISSLANYYLKSYIDSNIYNKSQIDNIGTLTNFYTKTQIDNIGVLTNFYNKTHLDKFVEVYESPSINAIIKTPPSNGGILFSKSDGLSNNAVIKDAFIQLFQTTYLAGITYSQQLHQFNSNVSFQANFQGPSAPLKKKKKRIAI
jgi:hypothetical protein